MKPQEVADIILAETNQVIKMMEQLNLNKASDFTNQDLLNWLKIALLQQIEFKLSIADLMHEIDKSYPDLEIDAILNENIYRSENEDNIKAPPFDKSFWMELGDL